MRIKVRTPLQNKKPRFQAWLETATKLSLFYWLIAQCLEINNNWEIICDLLEFEPWQIWRDRLAQANGDWRQCGV